MKKTMLTVKVGEGSFWDVPVQNAVTLPMLRSMRWEYIRENSPDLPDGVNWPDVEARLTVFEIDEPENDKGDEKSLGFINRVRALWRNR